MSITKVFGHKITAHDHQENKVWLASESITKQSSQQDLHIYLQPDTPMEKAEELARLLNELYMSVEIRD